MDDPQYPIPDTSTPILVYYNVRGNAQVIRSVLLEINEPFKEICICFEKGIPDQIAKPFNLDLKNVPYLIHDGNPICEIMAIIKYCCHRFNRKDLLGKTFQQQITVMQIMANYMSEKCIIMNIMFNGAISFMKNISYKKQQEIEQQGGNQNKKIENFKKWLTEKYSQVKHYVVLKKLFMKRNGYIMGYLTILDFLFFEACFYMNGLISAEVTGDNAIPNLYLDFFCKTPFYINNKQKIEKYKILSPESKQISECIKKIWGGDPKFI